MSEADSPNLSGVPETLLITLYLRAMESQRLDALIKDGKAVELVARLGYDFDRVRQIPLSEANKLVIILRNREFDRYARDFLARSSAQSRRGGAGLARSVAQSRRGGAGPARHPDAVVVHIGCGLDSRFERVAERNSQVEWYDLDFPDVVELRRKLIGGEGERYHLLGCSVLEDAWLDTVSVHRPRPFLFLAEGVFMYLREEQVKSLVLKLRDRFPGAELAFDCYSPLHVWVSNLQTSTSKIYTRVQWGIWRGQEMERWGDGIRLLDEWGFFDRPEPRLAHVRWWLRPIDALFRTLRIYHFQLGEGVP
jgi:O-methyltransferase involved in polyketide biosynthesis